MESRMNRKIYLQTFVLVSLFFFTFNCEKKQINAYAIPEQVPMPGDNLSNPVRIELGKALYFDPRLSGSNLISCATCHNPALGWADGLPLGIGHDFKELGRHSPSIINAAFYGSQFWDGRAATLEEQAGGPIVSAKEMNQDMDELIKELSSLKGYVEMFEKAYPKEGITKDTITKAIAVFERTAISRNSPFDRYMEGDKTAISESAARGFDTFNRKAKCAVCHSGYNFSDNGFHNIGVKSLKGEDDIGRFGIVPIKIMKGAFKTPTLRDIALTSPYMHNGIYKTLEEVIDHYDRKGDNKESLSPNMMGTEPLHLTEQEKKDLVEFLKSLTGKSVQVAIPVLPYE
jgi:cytochrome c peroxidase